MHFVSDKQTLNDLNIFKKLGARSIYNLFNQTETAGGGEVLEEMFHHPLSDQEMISRRLEIICYFHSAGTSFPFSKALINATEYYLNNADERFRLAHKNIFKKAGVFFIPDVEYKNIYKGVIGTIELLKTAKKFISSIDSSSSEALRTETQIVSQILGELKFQEFIESDIKGKLSFDKIAAYDNVLRFNKRGELRQILKYIYKVDVYIAIAKLAADRKFTFPVVLPKSQHIVKLEGVYHPFLKEPVANSLTITPESNIIFLTGANMAGKSTFMKSVGIAMLLAHMGFPVPAAKMEFSVRDGIYTTINLPDDLGLGVSHFYAEVLRVKNVTGELSQSKNLFVMFDELFRGTNVKDAHDATVAVTAAFAQMQNCMFIVSTHIIEAGQILKGRCKNINFKYLPTQINNNIPVYTYILEPGITDDRHGMIIINNEGIIDILKNGKNKNVV